MNQSPWCFFSCWCLVIFVWTSCRRGEKQRNKWYRAPYGGFGRHSPTTSWPITRWTPSSASGCCPWFGIPSTGWDFEREGERDVWIMLHFVFLRSSVNTIRSLLSCLCRSYSIYIPVSFFALLRILTDGLGFTPNPPHQNPTIGYTLCYRQTKRLTLDATQPENDRGLSSKESAQGRYPRQTFALTELMSLPAAPIWVRMRMLGELLGLSASQRWSYDGQYCYSEACCLSSVDLGRWVGGIPTSTKWVWRAENAKGNAEKLWIMTTVLTCYGGNGDSRLNVFRLKRTSSVVAFVDYTRCKCFTVCSWWNARKFEETVESAMIDCKIRKRL